jgi:hypothetical protein
MSEDWIVLDEVPGMLQAEILRGMLEAQEIPSVLSQEGAGRAIGITIGTLGAVQILVPSKDLDRAREILDAYYAGGDDQNEA